MIPLIRKTLQEAKEKGDTVTVWLRRECLLDQGKMTSMNAKVHSFNEDYVALDQVLDIDGDETLCRFTLDIESVLIVEVAQ